MGPGQLFFYAFLIGIAGTLAAMALWHIAPRVWRWAGRKVAQQMKHALGIEAVNEKLNELDETLLYVLHQQMEINERITKLEQATCNPDSPSSETEDKES